jgi:hypothetical protein
MPADAVEQRKLRSVARRYEREGYRVILPKRGGAVPAFLEGLRPDLIAESEGDRVVVEVKRSDAVRGSNELLEVAERVSREPGWRFELVTVPPVEQVAVPTVEHMDLVETRARQMTSLGLTDAAYVYVWAALEELLTSLASQQGLRVSKIPFVEAVRDLVARGVISREAFGAIEQARAVRSRLVHGGGEPLPKAEDVETLLALGESLRSGMVAAAG